MQGYGLDPAQHAAMMAAAHGHAAVGPEDWDGQHMGMAAADASDSRHVKAEADAEGAL